ncbi:hypothetical protein L211DRAFT_899599 [Terfezia boudieri ATCC MYA-4762]|uniref:Uncharacterized protein n=1 Tax=Terfezia boudieri ATCC MYA-4762 TaxID=1051890 RepID=A0A3N4LZ58_9PEZI|nr:hypothetical protein L211DRAFT_899599 [Terfezia boudieri ATCC MYA-4762]
MFPDFSNHGPSPATGQSLSQSASSEATNTMRTTCTYYIYQISYFYLCSTGYEPERTIAALAITMFRSHQTGQSRSRVTKSKPVRVITSDKMRHSKYAPTESFRYVSINWCAIGQDGFVTYKYKFRRDDPAPAPLMEEERARVENLKPASTGYEPEKIMAALAITMFPEATDPTKLDKAGAESSDEVQASSRNHKRQNAP